MVSEESAGGPGSLDLHHAQGLGQPPLQLLPAASADHLAEDLHNTTSYLIVIILFTLENLSGHCLPRPWTAWRCPGV